ncbi:MAG: phosphoribosylamine--glycine ligase [Myxococcaceae bacterium]|jgi:phosphoribosylamine--glycine ligase|nr:phosphoribosylamine--glycine ligase [Myxococcaceae bacterium]
MRVLLLGGGGREHALAWKLAQSPLLTALFAAPGNPGIEAHAQCRAIDPTKPDAVVDLVRAERIDLLVVGPEAPLVAGVADAVRALGVPVFGPQAAAARIEGSKAFAKEIMEAAGVPTARAQVFRDVEAAASAAAKGGPVVVKADGLAAGKGVVVADSGAEAAEAVRALGRLPAGERLLLEERLSGPELSVMALCDGERAVLLPPSQDHKRLLDGDQGPNTGGMGAYAPARLLSDDALEAVRREVMLPTLRELARRGTPFRGALYAGLMLTPQGPRVLEFNARLGDPETQVLMMQTADDLLPLLLAAANGALVDRPLTGRLGASVGIVLAAPGYPEAPRTGQPIAGLGGPFPEGTLVFHAGTRRVDGQVVTSGGRVLTVCARAESVAAARAEALEAAARVQFEGRQYRQDIAARAP